MGDFSDPPESPDCDNDAEAALGDGEGARGNGDVSEGWRCIHHCSDKGERCSSDCVPPPSAEDEPHWELVGDVVRRFVGRRLMPHGRVPMHI